MPDSKNFWFLDDHKNNPIYKTAASAEKYVFTDPNICLIKLRQFAEFLAKEIAVINNKQDLLHEDFCTIVEKLEKMKSPPPPALPREIKKIFDTIRKKGNDAVHNLIGEKANALRILKEARKLAVWYHKSYRTKINKALGAFTPPPYEKKEKEHFEIELEHLKDKLIKSDKKIDRLNIEANTAIELAEELETDFLKYIADIDNIIGSGILDLDGAKELASKVSQDIGFTNNDLKDIIDLKYYSIGFKIGRKKQNSMSQTDKENIQQIMNKYGERDPADGMAHELFDKYNLEWTDSFVKTKTGYVLKGLIIDESTIDLFNDEDQNAETFYNYMIGFVDGLTGTNSQR